MSLLELIRGDLRVVGANVSVHIHDGKRHVVLGSLLQVPAPLRESLGKVHGAPQHHVGAACEHRCEEEHLPTSCHIELWTQWVSAAHNDWSILVPILPFLHPLGGWYARVGGPWGETVKLLRFVEGLPLGEDGWLEAIQLAIVTPLLPLE